jgi:hypothetical protein
VSDPKRLLEEVSGFEAELLRAGRSDALPERSASAIAAALGVSQPAAAASTLGIASKAAAFKTWLAAAGLTAAGALSLWAGIELLSGHAPAAAPQPRLEAREQVPAEVVRDVEPPAPAETAEKSEPASPKATARGRVPAAPEVDTLPRELELIDRARSALARGDAPFALSLLNEYSTRFPKPHLRAESTVLRIEALVVRGQNDAALRVGREFLAREPNGPYARRVRSLLERTGASGR